MLEFYIDCILKMGVYMIPFGLLLVAAAIMEYKDNKKVKRQ